MCNTNDMDYCYYCQQWYKRGYIHTCSGMSYCFCSACGQYVYGNHNCVGTIKFYSYPKSDRHFKCPKCKGEFSEPAFKSGDTMTCGKYVCPFCGREMKGFNN